MVLHLGYNHLVAGLHLTFAERAGHQVNGLGSTTRKNNLLYLAGVDESTNCLASRLVQVGSLLRQVVYTTMHVGIHVEILVAHSVEHHQWFLCGSRIIQINQRLFIYLATQNREIFAYLI